MAQTPKKSHWQPPADQRSYPDSDFWSGVNLDLPSLRPVAKLLAAGQKAAAQRALVEHFRTRRTPKISPYHTDAFWHDWPNMPVEKRADVFLATKTLVPSEHSNVPIPIRGKASDVFGIDWDKAKKASIGVARQRITAELVSAWAKTHKRKYADGLEAWLRAFVEQCPFRIDPRFHPDEYAAFGGPAHPQLGSCYRQFVWGDMLQSDLFRARGVLSDDFWFWVIKQFGFYTAQVTRFIGSPFRADNHHLMERGVTPYYLGVQFPEFKRAGEMETYGRWIIHQHFDHNVLNDGSGTEHCTGYQYRCFIRFALPDSVARLNGRDLLGPERGRKLQRYLLFQGMATGPDGCLPDCGDGGGPPISEVVAQSGAMYESAELKAIDNAIGTASWPVNPAYVERFKRVKPRLPKELAAIYPIGGHLMLRDGWKRDSHFLWMSLKNGSLYNIHTHWDTLSFAISSYGRTMIGDPVSRTYGRMEGLARGYYFSMDAHNGLIVDDDILTSYRALTRWWGGQPSRIDSAFTAFEPAKTGSAKSGGFDYVSFSHPGYRPLLVRRDVLFVHGRYFVMTDAIDMDFSGFNAVFGKEGDIRPHEYKQPLHFEEGVRVKVRAADQALVTQISGGPNLLVVPEPFESLGTTLVRDEYMAALRPEPGVCLVGEIRRETIGKCMFSTVYRPFRGGPAAAPNLRVRALTPRTGPYRQDEFHAIEIRDGGRTDYWVVQRNRQRPKQIEIAQDGVKIRTDAAAALVSVAGGRVTGFICGGGRVELNGKRLALPRRALVKHALK